MAETEKVSISLPGELLEAVERERGASGESRSEFIRRSVEELLRGRREQEDVDRYIRGYLEEPESGDEVAWLMAAQAPAWAEHPWG